MKRIFTFSVMLLSYFFVVTTVSAMTRVYVKLVTDTQAWSTITVDANNIVKTVGTGGDYADFTSIDFNSTGLNLITGDEVWVAKGLYPFSKQLPAITNGINIYGGFSGNETSVSQRIKSDLDANGMVDPWEFTNTTKFVGLGNSSSTSQNYRMMVLNSGKILDGVTISDIYYSFGGSNTYAGGGEIQTGALIRNSIIQNITTICTSANTVNGGGLYINRGGMESCLVENCICDIQLSGNTQTAYGGGVCLNGSGADATTTCTGYVINSVIRNCTAGSGTTLGAKNASGGGILANIGARVENCVIHNNSVIANGGNSQGGGILGNTGGDAYLKGIYFVNLTVVNNFSNLYPGFFPSSNYASAYNCIVWQNGTGFTAGVPNYTGYSSIRLTSTTTITGYPYLDYMFYNTDAVTPIGNSASNKANPFTAFTAKVVLSGVDNSTYPGFTSPTTFVGSSYAPADITSIRQANWTLTDLSPLVNKGVAAPTNIVTTALITASPKVAGGNTFTFSPTDLGGKIRGSQYQLGAYQYPAGVYTSVTTPRTNKLSVYQENGTLQIVGAQGTTNVKLYSISGKLINSSSITGKTTGIQLPQHGVYLVSIKCNQETEVHKIVF